MWLERIVTILTMIGAIAGGFIYLDEHYASAADLKILELNLKKDRVDDRIKDTTNRIFELEFKQRSDPRNFKPLDAALLERYKSELVELQGRARALER